QKMVAPGDVRRDGRGEVDESAQRRGERGELRQRVGPAKGSEWIERHVQAEAPGGRVSAGREQVAPVLRDQPETGQRNHHGGALAEATHEDADREREQARRAELQLVYARA